MNNSVAYHFSEGAVGVSKRIYLIPFTLSIYCNRRCVFFRLEKNRHFTFCQRVIKKLLPVPKYKICSFKDNTDYIKSSLHNSDITISRMFPVISHPVCYSINSWKITYKENWSWLDYERDFCYTLWQKIEIIVKINGLLFETGRK